MQLFVIGAVGCPESGIVYTRTVHMHALNSAGIMGAMVALRRAAHVDSAGGSLTRNNYR